MFRAMAVAQYYLRPPTQTVEFVAKVFATGHVQGMKPFIGAEKARVILGTPLYVAQTDLIQLNRFRENRVFGLTERDWMLEGPKQRRSLLGPSPKEPANTKESASEKRKRS